MANGMNCLECGAPLMPTSDSGNREPHILNGERLATVVFYQVELVCTSCNALYRSAIRGIQAQVGFEKVREGRRIRLANTHAPYPIKLG